MKEIIIIALLFSALLNSCSRNSVNDTQFQIKYNNCLDIVKKSYYGDTYINSDSLYNSVQYLVLVTGVESNLYVGEVIGYISEEDVIEDIKNWSNWFDINKDSITLEYADSIFNTRLYGPTSSSVTSDEKGKNE